MKYLAALLFALFFFIPVADFCCTWWAELFQRETKKNAEERKLP